MTQVISSLPESYDMLVTALEAIPEIPNMETITEKIIHEERKIKENRKPRKKSKLLLVKDTNPKVGNVSIVVRVAT